MMVLFSWNVLSVSTFTYPGNSSIIHFVPLVFQDGQFKVDWASQAYCNFTIFVAVVMFVISLVQVSMF
jgi:hypothetical protein